MPQFVILVVIGALALLPSSLAQFTVAPQLHLLSANANQQMMLVAELKQKHMFFIEQLVESKGERVRVPGGGWGGGVSRIKTGARASCRIKKAQQHRERTDRSAYTSHRS